MEPRSFLSDELQVIAFFGVTLRYKSESPSHFFTSGTDIAVGGGVRARKDLSAEGPFACDHQIGCRVRTQ